ncbi:MAG: phosphoribosylformylglycinamidine synthase [Eubacterium sp.]|jgi:phosphoribosylformylglycinamidine synthase|nr:phosphoribosylformylglycinamidine synthase [Eubacterium sp.]MCH4046018.1 phosphoribosylformylglycinamidine synthase [Eubacterium sp.]MCH4079112.1 phosphoribosylformylglycinamidine synthase [Eubacterium sp.]MCH4110761.1 phosphoribosylformylglycinamidine synthase [Eubacterium sp.]MCI1306903.1 phosphoribosylformylglycinamidine synthase [Eubacterium sp.]
MVYRVYVEKKPQFANEAKGILKEAKELLQIEGLDKVRVINRYDAENLSEELFENAVNTVFSEPQVDLVYRDLTIDPKDKVFAIEYLPGQFDARANSAAECIQLISRADRPTIKTAKVFILSGSISDEDVDRLKKYIINPVEAREASLKTYDTLKVNVQIPTTVETLTGFNQYSGEQLQEFLTSHGLAMDLADLAFVQEYFKKEQRDPTITEIRVIDTYWSDHCRHTTYNTTLDSVKFEDNEIQKTYEEYLESRKEINRKKPVNLMDIGTIAAKVLRQRGMLDKLDASEEINACTIKIDVDVEGKTEKWLLLFKNETHNHPTEIEPFGGAATCIGGAIRDPLSGRSYVYAAMRVTGAANPLTPVSETMEGKLPQRKIVTTAADGYSSYGNQIGLATGQVDELYHPGYAAKRMEVGAVIAAAPQENVRRERPIPGDVVILLGGRTGRDGIGGATGSSKKHNVDSLEKDGAEVQKGNAPEERKLQRLFRNPEASKMIKRCNDFGAGGVSVAIGELADGLDINLDKVTKKYAGLDGTELAISESQERMAVVVAAEDADRYIELAHSENLEATVVAVVKENPYLTEKWNGETIVNISRAFLDTDGVEKHIDVEVPKRGDYQRKAAGDFAEEYKKMASDLNVCSKRGLSEEFDSTIGAGTVLMPFGGKYQRTPLQAMVHLISVEKKHTDTVSAMAYGFNPMISSASPYDGAYLAVIESISKLIAAGASFKDTYLSFQEYFGKPGSVPSRWGAPMAAMLGAYKAQMGMGAAAIGGKDSMSGTFENLDVPPTLISFAVTTDKAEHIISPEFKNARDDVILLLPETGEDGLPDCASVKALYEKVNKLIVDKTACAAYTPGYGGIAEAVLKMAMGNEIGFAYGDAVSKDQIFGYCYGGFLLEVPAGTKVEGAVLLGKTTEEKTITGFTETIQLSDLCDLYESKLEPVYRCNIETEEGDTEAFNYEAKETLHANIKTAAPKVLIPVFPGNNCEYDSAKAFADAGADPEQFIINNLTSENVGKSVEQFAEKIRHAQMIFIPGGFSGADEPDGSGKFITAFFRNAEIKEAVTELLEQRDGLMAGICNGFQALVKLGLVPYGKITEADADSPTLTFNTIGRHQSKLIRTRIASNKSPWLAKCRPGEIYTSPISHGEGRFIAPESLIKKMAENGQIATQYVDLDGNVSFDIQYNPNGSMNAIEGITSPDGRVFGKMAHCERKGPYLYKNVPGSFDLHMFESAVEYFK